MSSHPVCDILLQQPEILIHHPFVTLSFHVLLDYLSQSICLYVSLVKNTPGVETTSSFLFLYIDKPLFMLDLLNKIKDTQLIEHPYFYFLNQTTQIYVQNK